MLDIKFVAENPKTVKANLKKRFKEDRVWMVDELLKDYDSAKSLKKEIDDTRAKRNVLSKEINKLKKSKKDVSKQMKEAAKIPNRLNELEEDMELLEKEINKKLHQIPNILHKSVPKGKDETKNPEIKKVGKPKKFGYASFR